MIAMTINVSIVHIMYILFSCTHNFSHTTFTWQSFILGILVSHFDILENDFLQDLVSARLNPEEAYSETYTHCEIHPSLILGVCASIIPFPDHNQVCDIVECS